MNDQSGPVPCHLGGGFFVVGSAHADPLTGYIAAQVAIYATAGIESGLAAAQAAATIFTVTQVALTVAVSIGLSGRVPPTSDGDVD